MSGGLNATFAAAGVPSILDFTFYPWGNAYYNTKGCHTDGFHKEKGMDCWVKACGGASPPADCFTAPVLCQHGPGECEADTLEACVMHVHPQPTQYVPFLDCYEGQGGAQHAKAKGCATGAGLDWSSIQACASNTTLAATLDAANAKATAALGPSKLGTPWVIVDGTRVEDPMKLLSAVCKAYQGPKPAGCHGQ